MFKPLGKYCLSRPFVFSLLPAASFTVLQEFSVKTDLLPFVGWLELHKRCRRAVAKFQQPEPLEAAMVLFDLNNVRRTAAAITAMRPGHDYHSGAFQGDVLAAVKTVKRLSAHPWPFSVKSGASRETAEYGQLSQPVSSFVT